MKKILLSVIGMALVLTAIIYLVRSGSDAPQQVVQQSTSESGVVESSKTTTNLHFYLTLTPQFTTRIE